MINPTNYDQLESKIFDIQKPDRAACQQLLYRSLSVVFSIEPRNLCACNTLINHVRKILCARFENIMETK